MPTTFYLKYRPQSLSELDSTEAREELEKIFKSGKFPHAFLFSGPKGIGKTSAARIVAKAVNCRLRQQPTVNPLRSEASSQQSTDNKLEAGPPAGGWKPEVGFEPCNKCSSCISITNGTNVDVLEIDAASNRGIDDIKELREKIKLSPASSKYKVYIIDEAHMLTTEAFNALLKTLEEPPQHAIFILCTTDPEKLPKTITSRCQIINFKKANKKEIVAKLKKICEQEKLEFAGNALEEIAKLSDGSFRDANKILGQVSLSGKITEEEVRKIAGVSGEFKAEDLLLLLKNRQTKEALVWIGQAVEQGVSLKILLERMLDQLRILLLRKFGVEETQTSEGIDFSEEEIRFLIVLFTRAYGELRFAVIPQLPLEMAVIEWGESRSEGGKCDMGREVRVGSEKESKKDPPPLPISRPTSHFLTPPQFTLDDVISKWSQILEKVKPLNHSVQAFLRATRPIACEDGFLVLEVFYKFHKDQLESEKCRRIFEKVASDVLGSEVKLKCSLGEGPRVPKPIPKVDFTPAAEEVSLPKTDLNSQNPQEADIIKLAEEIFNKGGTIQ